MNDKLGQLWGIGVGPGDPELITVKALHCLQRCPVVAFPAGRHGRPGMAQTIVAPWLQPEQVQLPLWFPYVQDATTLETAWQAAATQVSEYLTQGQDVVFATEGDASFYSTFTYLAQAVQQQQPWAQIQTVPGVCSPLAAAAALGQPLTVQHQRLTILPVMHTLEALETALDQAEVVVLMKVAAVYAQVWQILQRRELLAQSRVVTHISGADQRIYDNLDNHPQLSLPYFSLLIVHCG
ncbi:MAG: precorrin-2 C(20)-methyltransferase [Leptolyngbya sp. RL_3_1]|nr:precorrin-2 C(20)-methyltransferase [Leptolyngbya sp. RL_3_1]